MKKKMGIVTTWIAGGALVLLAAGCASQDAPKNNATQFAPYIEKQQTNALFNQEIAAGAREESTLRAADFDGQGLNSGGIAHLDQMLADSGSCNPLVIYVDYPGDTLAADHKTAIGRYLMDRGGLKTEQIEFHDGPNPATFAPAEGNLANYARTDTSTGDAYSGGASGGASSGSGH